MTELQLNYNRSFILFSFPVIFFFFYMTIIMKIFISFKAEFFSLKILLSSFLWSPSNDVLTIDVKVFNVQIENIEQSLCYNFYNLLIFSFGFN